MGTHSKKVLVTAMLLSGSIRLTKHDLSELTDAQVIRVTQACRLKTPVALCKKAYLISWQLLVMMSVPDDDGTGKEISSPKYTRDAPSPVRDSTWPSH